MVSSNISFLIIMIFLDTWLQLFQSHTNNLQTVSWFQEFQSNASGSPCDVIVVIRGQKV